MRHHKAGSVVTAPRIAYKAALAKYVVVGKGVKTVEDCTASEMQTLVKAWVLTAEEPRAVELALKGLDYGHAIDRWYCLDTLLNHSCRLALFASSEAAFQYRKEH